MQAVITNRVDEIINQGLKDLERFYKNHGDWDGPKPKPKPKSKWDEKEKIPVPTEPKQSSLCQYPGCFKKARPNPQGYCALHNSAKFFPVPYTIPPTVIRKLSININGLNTRQIIDLVKKETGEQITVSVKSKKNVIRHAKLIFKGKGCMVHE